MSDNDSDNDSDTRDPDGLSAYERQRLDNIEKNKKVLESLGLLDGGGLIQRKGSSGAIQRKSKPRERPVVQVRVREQRSVKAPERLDPGADLVRKLQMQAEAAMGLAPVAPRCQPAARTFTSVGSSTAPVALHKETGSIEPPQRLHLGIADEDVYAHFHGGMFGSSAVPPGVGAAAAAPAAAGESTLGSPTPPAVAAFPEAEATPAADAAATAADAAAPTDAAAAATSPDDAPADGPVGMALPACPECDGASRALGNSSGRHRFQCKRPYCAHEWAANLCSVCGQPKRGHVCAGVRTVFEPARVFEPAKAPTDEEDEEEDDVEDEEDGDEAEARPEDVDEEGDKDRSPPKVGERLQIFYVGAGGGWYWGRVLKVEPLGRKTAGATSRAATELSPHGPHVKCLLLMDAAGGDDQQEDGPFDMRSTRWRRIEPPPPKASAHTPCFACQGAHRPHTCGRGRGGPLQGERRRPASTSDDDDDDDDGEEGEAEGEEATASASPSPAPVPVSAVTMEVELVVPSGVRDDRRIAFVVDADPRLGVTRYSATVPEGLQPGDSFKTRVPVRPKLSVRNPPPAVSPAQFVGNARRAARLKRQHTLLKQSGAFSRLQVAAAEAHAAALEAAALAYEQGLPGAHVVWMHPPIALPVGLPAASVSAADGPSKSASVPLELRRHGRQWLTLDETQGEEEAEAEAEAELEAEARAKRLMDYASWLPRAATVRAFIVEALKGGLTDRDAIYEHVCSQPDILDLYEANMSTLRSTVVTALGKEKNQKVPLFEQEDVSYLLTREGRLALDLEEDDDLEEWAQAREKCKRASGHGASSQGGSQGGGQGRGQGGSTGAARGKDARGSKRAASARESPPRPVFVPPPPPPDGWVFPAEGERIDVEVAAEDGGDSAWVTAEVLRVLVDGSFLARIELPDLSDAWEDWFTWQVAHAKVEFSQSQQPGSNLSRCGPSAP